MTATLFVHIVGTEKVLEHSKRSRLVMIFEKLSALIAEQFNVDPDTITMDTSFEDDLNADSVDIVDLSMALEEEFGIKIFYKNRRQLVPTPEGEVLIKYARRAYALSENLRQALSDVRSQVKSLTLAITPTAQNNIVPHLFAKYCNEHPNVHINIITDNINNIYSKLKMYEADLAIIEGNITAPHFTSILLDTDSLCAAVSVNHPLAKKQSVSLSELRNENFILRSSSAGTRSLFESHLISQNLSIHDFNVIMEIDSVVVIKELVASNMGVTIISKNACRSEVQKKKLVTLPIENMTMVREINMVYYREFRHPEILRDIQAIYTSTLES